MWKTSSRCGRVELDGAPHDALRDRSPRRQSKHAERSFSGPVSSRCLPEVTQEKGPTSKPPADSGECINRNRSSGTASNSLGAKLLRALRRKVLSSSNSKNRRLPASNSQVHDDALKQDDKRDSISQEEEVCLGSRDYEQLSVQQLQEELQKLRRILDSDRAEMLQLRNEVSWLRLGGTGGFSPVSEHNVQAPPTMDGSSFVSRTDSVRSDGSCLDFSLASTGMLKFEGETKAKGSPASYSLQETGAQLESFVLDEPLLGERKGNDSDPLNTSEETKHTSMSGRAILRNGAPGHHEPELVKHCHSQSGVDLKFEETFQKRTELQIIPPTFADEPEEFGCPSLDGQSARYSSRSPPKSASSTDGSEPAHSPGKKSDSDTDSEKSFVLHKEDLLKVAGGQSIVARADSARALSESDVIQKLSPAETRRCELEESLRVGVCNPINECESEALETDKSSDVSVSKDSIDPCLITPSLRMGSSAPSRSVSDDKQLSGSEVETVLMDTPIQGTQMPPMQSGSPKSASVTPFVPEDQSLRPRSNPRESHRKSNGLALEVGSPKSGEAVPRMGRLSRSKSQGSSSLRDAPGLIKVGNKSYAAAEDETSSSSRQARIEKNALSPATNTKEMLYPELELDKLSKTLKSLGHDRNWSPLHASKSASRSIIQSRNSPSAMAEQPRRSLDSQVNAFSYTDSSRSVIGAWYDYNEKQSRSAFLSSPSTSFYSDNPRHLDRRHYSGGWSQDHDISEKLDFAVGAARQEYTLRSSSPSTARSPSRSPLRSPSRFGSESQLHEVVSGAILKSGSGVSIEDMLAYNRSAASAAENPSFDGLGRRHVEQSRSDVTARNSDEIDFSGARSPRRHGEEPFSVLALSRRRRSMEKEKTMPRETESVDRGQRSSLVHKEDRSIPRSRAVLDGVEAGGKSSCSRRRSYDGTGSYARKLAGYFDSDSRGADCCLVQAKAADNRSIITPRKLREAMDSWDTEGTADAPSDEQSMWDFSTAPPRSRSRSRSRFYMEATSPVYSGFGSHVRDIYSLT